MVDHDIVTIVRRYLGNLDRQGLPVAFGVLFGSQVHGRGQAGSDIDLMVVSPSFDADKRREEIDLLWITAAHTDSRIEPIAVGARQWEEDDGIPIIETARREGEIVYL